MARPSGLNPDDNIKCQPLRSAWCQAEAETKAALEANARGEEVEKNVALGLEQRLKLDAFVKDHYHFVWPATWLSGNTLLGKLKRMYEKRTDFVPRLEADVKNILEKEGSRSAVQSLLFETRSHASSG